MVLIVVDIKRCPGDYTNIRLRDPSGMIEGTLVQPLAGQSYPDGLASGTVVWLVNVAPHIVDSVRLTILPGTVKRVFPATTEVPEQHAYRDYVEQVERIESQV